MPARCVIFMIGLIEIDFLALFFSCRQQLRAAKRLLDTNGSDDGDGHVHYHGDSDGGDSGGDYGAPVVVSEPCFGDVGAGIASAAACSAPSAAPSGEGAAQAVLPQAVGDIHDGVCVRPEDAGCIVDAHSAGAPQPAAAASVGVVSVPLMHGSGIAEPNAGEGRTSGGIARSGDESETEARVRNPLSSAPRAPVPASGGFDSASGPGRIDRPQLGRVGDRLSGSGSGGSGSVLPQTVGPLGPVRLQDGREDDVVRCVGMGLAAQSERHDSGDVFVRAGHTAGNPQVVPTVQHGVYEGVSALPASNVVEPAALVAAADSEAAQAALHVGASAVLGGVESAHADNDALAAMPTGLPGPSSGAHGAVSSMVGAQTATEPCASVVRPDSDRTGERASNVPGSVSGTGLARLGNGNGNGADPVGRTTASVGASGSDIIGAWLGFVFPNIVLYSPIACGV